MRKNILIYSHSYHTFLLNEIENAARNFNNVIVICMYNKELSDKFKDNKNIKMYLFTKKNLYFKTICNFYKIFSNIFINDLKDAKANKVMDFTYFKNLLMFLGLDKLLNSVVKKEKISKNANEWIFVSAWYYGTAYAIAKQKEKNNSILAVSLAHSFEIDKDKNKYINVLLRKWYHSKLDLISFISQNVKKDFESNVAKTLNLSCSNTEVVYLGTKKLIDSDVKLNQDKNTIKVLSCSNVIDIKRIPLIFQALNEIKDYNVVWYHIGTGKNANTIFDEFIKNKNSNLQINYLGFMQNVYIHKFITENELDLFINVSKSEGIPVSIMEALAYGLPIVATNVGGNSEIVDNRYGRIISKNPPIDEIIDAIIEIKNLSDEVKLKNIKVEERYF